METMLDQKFYTLKEAAEILGVTLTTARTYVTKGVIPARKIKKWLIREEDLKNHIKPSPPPVVPSINNNQGISEPSTNNKHEIIDIVKEEVKKLLEEERGKFFSDLEKYFANYHHLEKEKDQIIAKFVLQLISLSNP